MKIHKTAHILGKRKAWTNTAGQLRHLRSYTNRANIFAMTGGVYWNTNVYQPNRPSNIVIRLHSALTWKHPAPELVSASTELWLTRDDAASLAAILLASINDLDQERGRPA
jgi:hypothetical protein